MAFQALIGTMTSLNKLHLTLLELAESKKYVLIHNEVGNLTQINTKENKLLKQIGELDRERVAAIGDFLMEKGYKPNPKVTVSDLSKIIFNMEDKKQLTDSQRQLVNTIRRLRQTNVINQQLIEQSLTFIDYSIDILMGPPEDEAVYHRPQQQMKTSKRPGLFDAKA